MKEYIDLNTKLRQTSRNDFEKNLFKLMNNSVFGKTMENLRKHVNVKLVTKWHGRYGAKALIAKPNFHSQTIFNENLVAIELRKTEIFMNKPIYLGQVILDISKICLFNFHYEYILHVYGDKCKCLYTDTDSLIYEISDEDPYEVIKRDFHMYDTSDYDPNNIYNIKLLNKKRIGIMKDEMNGRIITEFVGLRPKMYSFKINGSDAICKAKGVKSNVVKNSITFDDYKKCLNDSINVIREQNTIRSYKHNVFSVKQKKIALSSYDDKRFLIKGTHNTLPWGHHSNLEK